MIRYPTPKQKSTVFLQTNACKDASSLVYFHIPAKLLDESNSISYPLFSLLLFVWGVNFRGETHINSIRNRKIYKTDEQLFNNLRELERLGFLKVIVKNRVIIGVRLNVERYNGSKLIAIWRHVFNNRNISYKALPVFVCFANRPDQWLSHAQIRSRIGCSEKTFIKYCNDLTKVGYLSCAEKTQEDINHSLSTKRFTNNKVKFVLNRKVRCFMKPTKSTSASTRTFLGNVYRHWNPVDNPVSSTSNFYDPIRIYNNNYILSDLYEISRFRREKRDTKKIAINNNNRVNKMLDLPSPIPIGFFIDLKPVYKQFYLGGIQLGLVQSGHSGVPLNAIETHIEDIAFKLLDKNKPLPTFNHWNQFIFYMVKYIRSQERHVLLSNLIPKLPTLREVINSNLWLACKKEYSLNFMTWKAKQFLAERPDMTFKSEQHFINFMTAILEKEKRTPGETSNWDPDYDYRIAEAEDEAQRKRLDRDNVESVQSVLPSLKATRTGIANRQRHNHEAKEASEVLLKKAFEQDIQQKLETGELTESDLLRLDFLWQRFKLRNKNILLLQQ